MLVLGEVELRDPPKVLVLGVPLGCLFRGSPFALWEGGDRGTRLWQPSPGRSLQNWGLGEIPWGYRGVLSGSPFPERPLAKPLTLDPPQVSGSLRQKAVPDTELQELRSRTERAERRLLACENLVGELGSGVAALSTLLQGYGQLQQRLLNLENLLKNRNFWILRLPPSSGGEIPKVAAAASRGSCGTVEGLGAELLRVPTVGLDVSRGIRGSREFPVIPGAADLR